MPHILVLAGPPNAQLHLVTFSGKLVITSTQPLTAPTPNLRRQEFFTGVVSNSTSVIVSLWTGLLAHIEMELEKSKDAKRRTSIAGSDMDLDEVARRQARRLVFKSSSNIKWVTRHESIRF
jgi:DNA damage-binding protein 1